MQLVVLAAGRGTRLRPVTEDRSKAMVPVLGRPLVELAIRPWIACGINEVIAVIAPADDEFRSWAGTGVLSGCDIRFVEQAEPLGMAHALGLAAPMIRGDFALTACDSLVPAEHVVEIVDAHRSGGGVLSLMEVEDDLVARSAAVELDGDRVARIVEKPSPAEAPSRTVSLPHYVLPKAVLAAIPELAPSPRGEIELQDAIQMLIERGVRFTGVETADRRQVSSPGDLLRLNLDELRMTGGVDPPEEDLEARFERPIVIDDGVRIGHGCTVGPNVYLEEGCVVGNEVAIRNSIVLRSAWVPTHSDIDGEVLV